MAKLAVSSGDPLLVAGLLYLGSGIGLAISRAILAGPPIERVETPLSRLPWLADATLAGGVAGPALLLLSTNTFTITTSITSTNILPSTRQANPTRTAISTRAWRIPTHTTPTSIIVTITKP
jgi:hypothetical protein